MSLMRSLNAGVSGLQGFQTKMDVIGNNIANINTTGFKAGRVTFSEMMTQFLTRGGQAYSDAPQFTNQIGLGVRVSSIDRDMSQGIIETTNRPTDLAIEGGGYFMVNNGQQNMLTRAGNFTFNRDGYLVSQQGLRVQGYNADSSGSLVAGGATENLRINFEDIFRPQSTQNVYLSGNLNNNPGATQVVSQLNAFTVSGNLADGNALLNSINHFSGLNDGDSVSFTLTAANGNTTQVSFPFEARIEDDTDPDNIIVVQEGSTLADLVAFINANMTDGSARLEDGIIIVTASTPGSNSIGLSGFQIVDGTDPDNVTNVENLGFEVTREGSMNTKTISSTVYDGLGQAHTLLVEFSQMSNGEWGYEVRFLDGQVVSSGQSGEIRFDENGQLTSAPSELITFNPGNGASEVTFNLNFSSDGRALTQYNGPNSANAASQDGYAQGDLVDFVVDSEGFLVGTYSNGRSKNLGQIALANVTNAQGLQNNGGGLFSISPASGDLAIDVATNLSGSAISSGALEGSNVDLAREFTDMIITQRAYQSSARVIQTADQILAEAVNLKR